MAAEQLPKYIGERIKRREDPALMTGRGQYTSDLRFPGMLHFGFVRSTLAHARVIAIDTVAARELPGVVGIWTATEVKQHLDRPLPMIWDMTAFETSYTPLRYILSEGTVRYVGEPLAVVVAETAEAVIAGVEAVFVDYEELPAVIELEAALAADAPVLYAEHGSNCAFRKTTDVGDVDKVFADAPVTAELRIVNQRVIPSAIEPRAVTATYEDGVYTLWTTTQMPHLVQEHLVDLLGAEAEQVRVIAPDVGGGFGAKANLYRDEVLAPILAREFKRPVQWVASRQEDNVATIHGRAQTDYVSLAADRDGRILGLKLKVLYDCGATYTRMTPIIPLLTEWMLTGTYNIATTRCEIVGVLTNCVPTEAYRGAGRPEATYLLERAVDNLAQELGLDPVAVRRRNFIRPEQFPYTNTSQITYDSGDYEKSLAKALELADYDGLRQRQERQRAAGGSYLGIGVSTYVEICGFGPWEYGSVAIAADGSVTVLTGTSPHGQGHQTTWAQIVAETLQVPYEQITVKHGDTKVVKLGLGTYGSRSAPVGGIAVMNAATTVRDKARKLAAELLEAAPADIVLEAGRFHVQGVPGRAIAWEAVISAAQHSGLSDALSAEEKFEPKGETFPFGAHVCVVEIDPETGLLTIERYISVDDCGRVINPLIVDGQVHGGLAQGISQALYEGVIYDESGNLLTSSLLEYVLPRADMLPRFETARTETPTPLNAMGIKGIGEAATIGSTPAVVNAAVDALAHLGVRHLDMPLHSERLWTAIQNARQ